MSMTGQLCRGTCDVAGLNKRRAKQPCVGDLVKYTVRFQDQCGASRRAMGKVIALGRWVTVQWMERNGSFGHISQAHRSVLRVVSTAQPYIEDRTLNGYCEPVEPGFDPPWGMDCLDR